MTVKLRKRKTQTGKFSLYLDIYNGTIVDVNGKKKPVRTYEFLNLYLDTATTSEARQANLDTLQLAESIRFKRQLEGTHTQHGSPAKLKLQGSFIDYLSRLAELKKWESTRSGWRSTVSQVKSYAQDKDVPFSQVTPAWINGLKAHLFKSVTHNSAFLYFSKVVSALDQAVKANIIAVNPADNIPRLAQEGTHREVLTVEELQLLARMPCEVPVLKQAFLFSALTGLRCSDIKKLTWGEVTYSEALGYYITFRQQKTHAVEVLPISQQARALLGEEKASDERVFRDLGNDASSNYRLRIWFAMAGITKRCTLYSARHTYATLLITGGTDIYAVSKVTGSQTDQA